MSYMDLVRAIEEIAVASTSNSGELAYLGFASSNGYSIRVSGRPNFLWVRLAESDERTPVQALNLAQVRILPDLPVRVRREDGVLSIIGYDALTVDDYLNGTPISATTSTGNVETAITARSVLPGLVHAVKVSGSYGLDIQIEGFYYFHPVEDVIKRFDTTTTDMTSYLPATANQHKYVVVGIDPSDNTVDVVSGTAKPVTINLTSSDITSIDIGDMIPLAAVKLTYGQTAINNDYSFVDLRMWWDAPGAPLFLRRATTDVSNPPTAAELDAAFGTPDAVGDRFARIIDDNDADANVYLVVSNGTSWWYTAFTKAT